MGTVNDEEYRQDKHTPTPFYTPDTSTGTEMK